MTLQYQMIYKYIAQVIYRAMYLIIVTYHIINNLSKTKSYIIISLLSVRKSELRYIMSSIKKYIFNLIRLLSNDLLCKQSQNNSELNDKLIINNNQIENYY
jgi:hypothetical protein